MSHPRFHRLPLNKVNQAFTLFELVVVIVIIAVLTTLLMSSIQTMARAARKVQCLNNHRQVCFALASFAKDFRGWLPPGGSGGVFTKQWTPRIYAANPQGASGSESYLVTTGYLPTAKLFICPEAWRNRTTIAAYIKSAVGIDWTYYMSANEGFVGHGPDPSTSNPELAFFRNNPNNPYDTNVKTARFNGSLTPSAATVLTFDRFVYISYSVNSILASGKWGVQVNALHGGGRYTVASYVDGHVSAVAAQRLTPSGLGPWGYIPSWIPNPYGPSLAGE